MIGSLGVPELVFILVLALLIFGPRKLPQIGRTLGRGMAEFRKASTELKRTLNAEVDALEEETGLNEKRTRRPEPRQIQPAETIAPPVETPAKTVARGSSPSAEGSAESASEAEVRAEDEAGEVSASGPSSADRSEEEVEPRSEPTDAR